MQREAEQAVERREGTSRNDVERVVNSGGAAGNDADIGEAKVDDHLTKELDPFRAWLDKRRGFSGQDRNDQAGKARARTDVDPAFKVALREGQQLRAIANVAIPDFAFGRRGDEILAPVFGEERRHVAVEYSRRFT
jgi:hypothetical protein